MSKVTLRDFFAGQALQGLIAQSTSEEMTERHRWIPGNAYMLADRMMEERNKKASKRRKQN